MGDSPVDPINHSPLWSEPDFDDSKWETVDLTPRDASLDPVYGVSGVVPGWTDHGHVGHWGYAWYRIRVQVAAPPGEKLALEGPPGVDDGYQVFQNGNLLGSFGGFSSSRPVVYNTQQMRFALPQSANAGSTTRVLAFRVWMEPSTPANYPDVGGLRTAPLLGEAGAVTANYQLRWLDAFRGIADLLVSAAVFGLFALVAFSLTFFDRSDRVYLWLGVAFLLTAMFDAVVVLLDTTQYIGIAVGPTPVRRFASANLCRMGYGVVELVWASSAGVAATGRRSAGSVLRGLDCPKPEPVDLYGRSVFSQRRLWQRVSGYQVTLPAADACVHRSRYSPGGSGGLVGPTGRGAMGSCAVLGGAQLSAYPSDMVSIWRTGHAQGYSQPAPRVRNRRVATVIQISISYPRAFVESNRAIAVSSIHVLIRLGPAFDVEDWYVRSGGRRQLLSMIRSR